MSTDYLLPFLAQHFAFYLCEEIIQSVRLFLSRIMPLKCSLFNAWIYFLINSDDFLLHTFGLKANQIPCDCYISLSAVFNLKVPSNTFFNGLVLPLWLSSPSHKSFIWWTWKSIFWRSCLCHWGPGSQAEHILGISKYFYIKIKVFTLWKLPFNLLIVIKIKFFHISNE